MKNNLIEWLSELELQTLTDELKSEIIERFQTEIEDAVNNSGGLVDEVFWEEQYTHTRGEQYFDERFNCK
jgi:hypothetical protein